MSRKQDDGGPDVQAGQDLEPERHELAESRILDGENGRVGKFGQKPGDFLAGQFRCGGIEPAIRERPGVVPAPTELRQQPFMEFNDGSFLPEAARIIDGRTQKVAAQLDTVQVEHTRERRSTTPVHPQHQDAGLAGAFRSVALLPARVH